VIFGRERRLRTTPLASASEYPNTFPENGQYTTALYALSVVGVKPSAFVRLQR